MRELVKEFVALCEQVIDLPQPVYEFGSLNVPGQEGFADLRSIFSGKEYIGADMRYGPGVDVILDLHDIDLPDATAGTIVCVETLEHVKSAERAVKEMRRVLKPDGALILTSVMNFPIHDYPSDYWRFTPEAFHYLFEGCASVLVESAGDAAFPHTVAGIAFNYVPDQLLIEELKVRLSEWRSQWVDPYKNTPWSAQSLSEQYKQLEEQHKLKEAESLKFQAWGHELLDVIKSLESNIADLQSERDLYKSKWMKLMDIKPLKWLYILRQSIR